MKHIEKIPSMCNCAFWTFPLHRRMTHFVSLQNFQGQSLKVPKQKHLKVLRLFNLGEVNGIPIPRTPNFEWSWEICCKMEGVYLNWLNWRFPLWSRRGQTCLQQLRKLQRQNPYSLNVCWILGTSRASSLKGWRFEGLEFQRGRNVSRKVRKIHKNGPCWCALEWKHQAGLLCNMRLLLGQQSVWSTSEPRKHVRVQMSVAFVSMLTVPVMFWCPQSIWWLWWCWVGSIPKNKCHTLRVLQDYICASTRLGLFLSYALCDLDKVQPGYLYRPSCEMFPKRIFTYHLK